MALPKIKDTEQPDEGLPDIPALKQIMAYFGGQIRTLIFDGFGKRDDHTDYFTEEHPQSELTKACVAVERVAFKEIVQNLPMTYVPCGISSGWRAHQELANKNANREGTSHTLATSTYKAEEHLGDRHVNGVMGPNKGDNLRRARIVGRMMPDNVIIAPVVREGAVRIMSEDPSFSNRQRYEEEDFMAFWYPTIDECKAMVLDGDWNYSRNSIWEMMRGVLIQAGQVPLRPKADMEVTDLEGNPVTLLARAEKVTEMLKYQLGMGFTAKEAATALAQIFKIDQDIRECKIPSDQHELHPILKHRPPAELMAMDKLKAEIEPILLKHCAHYMRMDNLPEQYQAAAAASHDPNAEERKPFKAFADKVTADYLKTLSVTTSPELRKRLRQTKSLPRREFDSHERFFEKSSHALMFEDDLYKDLAKWEKVALPFAIGATETGLYPTAHPMSTMIFSDLKRGKVGFDKAQSQSPVVHNMDEFRGQQGSDISSTTDENARQAEDLKARLQAEHPGQVVVNTLSFKRISDTIAHFRKVYEKDNGPRRRFVSRDGGSETSPKMRLALQMKYLDRNVEHAVFQEGWEHSNDLVQLRVRARMIQAGLVERPGGSFSEMTVASAAHPDTPETLLTDLELLTKEVKRVADTGGRAPEQALALARLVTLHELLQDQQLQQSGGPRNRELISTLRAETSVTCYDLHRAQEVVEEAKDLLKKKAAIWVPRGRFIATVSPGDDEAHASAKRVQNRRMDDYIKAQDVQWGDKALRDRKPPEGDIQQGSGWESP